MDPKIVEFKERTGIRKISGLMMLHYFKWPWCLEALTGCVDEIHLLLHYSPAFKADWPKSCPKVKKIIEIEIGEEWQMPERQKFQGGFRDRLLRSLDEVRPDLVLFIDEDESYPEPEFLAKDLWRLHHSRKSQLAFKRCNFWNSMETVRKDKWIYYSPHVKAYKWRPGLSYVPYRGFNRVNPYGPKRVLARSVIRHYAYMDKAEREWRYREFHKSKQEHYRGLMTEPKLVKYTNARSAPRT